MDTPVLDGLNVYVPSPDSPLRHTIRAGAGIVGTPQRNGRILIDFEGNLYDAVNMREYEQRVFHAHDRHTWRGVGYPTVARAWVDFDDVIEIGSYSPTTQKVTIFDQPALDAWLAEEKP